ncbi:predicted protein [Plenodomus lingam JN3]|uniref:Predicted protein n=1 Tax=Leptosphaeria maculans (strain JN3 / isolate v23.1.3 / race Av1-4-5-6-7-8) TaxID=985895 RepID=E5ABW6_LEPMJ|nr:predicted protein [Plenodomus lingam JN3]CBY01157.1 predicted protein [Plenodomus lingam JN3]
MAQLAAKNKRRLSPPALRRKSTRSELSTAHPSPHISLHTCAHPHRIGR